MIDWTIEEESGEGGAVVALVRHRDGGGSVITIDRNGGQCKSIIPADAPADGGAWFAPLTDKGISYVTSPRSWATARKYYRKLAS